MLIEEYIKLPRLYVDAELREGLEIPLSADQMHYLKNVLRRAPGDLVRLFNGKDGEWAGTLTLDKKTARVRLTIQLRHQPPPFSGVHLLFAPIKKTPMEFLVEKAVELGVNGLHPVITHRTENRNVNLERLNAQILEAAEQCERLTVPVLHAPEPLFTKLQKWSLDIPLIACVERASGAPYISEIMPQGPVAFLIGPEGGFDVEERDKLEQHQALVIASLGETVLRAETAALKALSLVKN